jgi:hypothetical protein
MVNSAPGFSAFFLIPGPPATEPHLNTIKGSQKKEFIDYYGYRDGLASIMGIVFRGGFPVCCSAKKLESSCRNEYHHDSIFAAAFTLELDRTQPF